MLDRAAFIKRLQSVPQNAPSLRTERKRISKEVAALDRSALFSLARDLIDTGIPRFVAYELLLNHQAAFDSITPSAVERLGKGISHWGDVDSFAYLIAGPAWRSRKIPDRMIRAWARSDDWCWRRAALVSTVPLNSRARGGAGDSKGTLAICEMLAADRYDLVVKALSWALRELGKRDPDGVRCFLATNHDRLATRVIREVNNKLATGRKNPGR